MNIIHVVVLIIFSVFLSINIFKLVLSKRKSKLVRSKVNFNHNKFVSKKFSNIKTVLSSMGYPYGLNFKNYFFIKYILSLIFFLSVFFRTNNLSFAIIYFLIIFFIPNFLIYKFKKKESVLLLKEIKNLTNNLVLLLSANVSFYDSLKVYSPNIQYKRFKEKFEIFIEDYNLYNFNIKPALEKFKNNFNSDEFEMLVNIIKQGDREGKMLEMLEVFQNTLELSIFKYHKYVERRISSYVLIASMLSLINIGMITIYPMLVQIFENLNIIFG